MYKKLYNYAKFIFLAVVVITLSLISTFGAIQSTDTLSNEAYAEVSQTPKGTASVINLLGNGRYKNNFKDALEGKQEEYIYFGTKEGTTTPIAWRVLSTNDNKYGDGGILLWAEDTITTTNQKYNPSDQDRNQAFWGTSYIRAKLNGGDTVASGTIDITQSFYNLIFKTEEEKKCVVKTKDYETKLWGYNGEYSVSGQKYYKIYTNNLVGDGKGQYSTADLSSAGAKYVTTKSNYVIETTTDDKLFLLDYYDINNSEYGFGKADTIYAEKVMNKSGVSWNKDPNGYPGFNDNDSYGSITSTELASTVYYCLRPSGHVDTYSRGLLVDIHGSIDYSSIYSPRGVRPAFIFNPGESLIYATASINGFNGTFGDVTTGNNEAGFKIKKPTYKVYLKATDYVNYNEKPEGAPNVSIGSGNVTVTKSGQKGSAVILLSDKQNSGVVSYQATATFDGSGVATATLPTDINAGKYNITVLLVNDYKGGNYAEAVNGSYTYSGLATPTDFALTYRGRVIDKNDLAGQPWYNASIYNDTSKMEIKFEKNIQNAGEGCKVTFKLLDTEMTWADGTQGGTTEAIKEITITITEAPLRLNKIGESPPEWEVVKSGLLGGDSPPKIIIYYKGRDGTTYEESTTKPMKKGKYTATAQLEKGNYKLDETDSNYPYTADFEIFATQIPIPTVDGDASVTYNGYEQTFDILNYNASDMTYKVTSGAADKFENNTYTAKDAGTYTIEFNLIDQTGDSVWAGTNSMSAQTLTITIDKAKLSVPITNNEQGVPIAGAVNGLLGGDADPLIYSYTGGSNFVGDKNNPPTKVGRYTFTITAPDDCNYVLKDGNYTQSFEIKPKPVNIPIVQGSSSKDYNGTDIDFIIANFDSADIKCTIDGVLDETFSGTFTAKNAGTYTIEFNLRQPTETVWAGTTSDNTPKTINITINKKVIHIEFGNANNNSWSWQCDTDMTVWITHDGDISGDSVEFVLNYGTGPLQTETVGNKTSATIPGLAQDTKWTLTATLADASANNQNANYELAGIVEQKFNITGKEVTFVDSDLQWICENSGNKQNVDSSTAFKVTYNGSEYTLYVDETILDKKGVRVKKDSYIDNKRTNAGKGYIAKVTIEAKDGYIFTDKEFTLEWEIEKATIDVSKVVWNYTEPFVYQRIGGVETEREVKLLNLPKELEGKIKYTGDVKASKVGTYSVSFDLVDFDNNNYFMPTFSIQKTRDWKITAYFIETPTTPSDFEYDDTAHDSDFVNMFGLPDDWSEYLEYTITRNNSDATSIKDAGNYTVKFSFIPDVVGSVKWNGGSMLPQSVKFKILRKQLVLVGWENIPPMPCFETDIADKYFELIYKDSADNVVDINYVLSHVGEQFSVTLQIPSIMGDNVEIVNPNGVALTQYFSIFEGEPDVLTKPELTKNEFGYNGNEVDITQYLLHFEKDYMTIVGDIKMTNAGEYSITISIKGSNAVWDDAESTNDDVVLTWSIAKATINVEWKTTGKTPVLKLDTTLADAVEYIFYDNGVEVAKVDLVDGKEYTVKAKLKDEYAVNYVFGETESEFTNAKTFTYDKNAVDGGDAGDGDGNGGNNGGNGGSIITLPDNFPLWQMSVSGVSILLSVFFIAKTIGYNSKRKKEKRSAEKSRKMYAFAPMFGSAKVLWGLSATAWTSIAFGLLGFSILLFVAMMISRHKWLLAAEDAHDAELERRESDMKMLIMMMNNRGNSGVADDQAGYTQVYQPYNDNVEEIVTRVVTALLPTMQALPTVSDETTNKQLDKLTEIIVQQSQKLEKLDELEQTIEQQNVSMEMQSSIIEQQSKVIEDLQYKMYNDDYDDEDEWVDDEEEDFYEPDDDDDDDAELFVTDDVPVGKRVHVPSNFRIRMKLGSDKNRNAYAVIKNKLGSFKKVSFRISGRIEKVMYKGEPLMYIGVVRKSLKLWLALDPNEFDAKRYFQRDASDKVRYQKVPMLVRVGSDRALKRADELIEILAAQYGLELRRKYNEKSLQELAYTLKGNALVKDKMPELLREVIHTHDADILTNEDAEKYIETREKLYQAEENFATISIDVLEENFYDGQKVTLEKLQKKGLVAEECNGYRLTAGERLTKPLYVVADEFAPTAVKMIVLTGGRVIQLAEIEEKI